MPELPEVETVVRHIKEFVQNRTITNARVVGGYDRVIAEISPRKFKKLVSGQKIKEVRRRAKLIVLDLERGCVAIHLRMTGRLLQEVENAESNPHVRFAFEFSDQSKLYFKDVRKFGRIQYFSNPEDLDAKYGVEPLSKEFTPEVLKDVLLSKSRNIKPLLLEQKYIVGLGNIYVDEVLWHAKIHPESKSNSIDVRKVKPLHKAIVKVLKASIEANGTTFQSFYFGEEASGEFKSQLAVFGRKDEPCKRCKTKIEKIRVAQRGTHYCPKCQLPE